MNFVDRFILDENLEDFELENTEYSELFLGIILGNIEKVKLNPGFCRNLALNHSISPTIKVVFLKKIIQKLHNEFVALEKNNNFYIKDLVGQFNEASNILYDVFNYLGEMKEIVCSWYSKLFRLILSKFSVYENLVSVPINSYRFKELLNLRSSFFLLPKEDLELFQSKVFKNTQIIFNLLAKSCDLIETNRLEPKDELSILTFNTFYNFYNYLLEGNIDFDYKRIIDLLIRYNQNFSLRQKQRFREFYNKLRQLDWIHIENNQFIGLFSLEPDYQVRKVTQETYSNQKRSYNSAPKPIVRRDYNVNKLHIEKKPYDSERPKMEPDKEIDNSIKTQLQYLIDSLKHYASDGHVDEDYIASSLKDLMNISETSLIYHLADLSYFETEFNFRTMFAWGSILKGVEKIENYPKLEFSRLVYYVEYLKDQSY